MNKAFTLDSDHFIRLARWRQYGWLVHGFGTRHAAPLTGMVATAKQVHGADVLVAEGAEGVLGPGDSLITDIPGQTVAIRTADCVPAIVVDPVHRAVAAVHAGWKGTVAGILRETIDRMSDHYGSDPQHVEIALGPSIAECCFEVGPEVAAEFKLLFPDRDDLDGRTYIDLIEANGLWAKRAGVPETHIFASAECTRHRADLYHSHRRDKAEAGRMVAMAGIRTER